MIDRKGGRERDRDRERKTDRQTGIQTETERDVLICICISSRGHRYFQFEHDTHSFPLPQNIPSTDRKSKNHNPDTNRQSIEIAKGVKDANQGR